MADAAAGRSGALAVIQAMRVHQWVKNLLVFVPILLDHKLSDPAIMLRGLIAFVAFCLAASGGYVVNDLMDLEADRNHPAKRERPFASSALPAEFGMVLAPLLLLSSVVIGATLLPGDFLALLLLYIVLTISYSAYLKRIAVLVLALYLNSDDVMSLYRKPAVLFLICPLLLFWTGWMWLQAHRGQIHEDPIVASARDPASYIVAALVALVLYAAL